MNLYSSQIFSKNQKVLLKDFSGASFAQILTKIFNRSERFMFLVVEDQKRAEVLKDQIEFFSGSENIDILPAFDVKPYYGLSPHRQVLLSYLRIFHRLLNGEIDFLIAPKQSIFRRTLSQEIFSSLTITLAKNDLVDRDELIQKLILMGYERASVVEEPGDFAVRGDILDIFSPQFEWPVRISLFDIEIEEIKTFTPSSQRTKDSLAQISIIPAHEVFLNQYVGARFIEPVDSDTKLAGSINRAPTVNSNWKSDLKKRADQRDLLKSKRDQIEEFISNKIYFHGIEFFLPLFYTKLGSVFDYLPRKTVLVFDLDNTLPALADHHLQELHGHYQDSDHIESIFAPEDLFLTGDELQSHIENFPSLYHELDPVENAVDFETVRGGAESNALLTSKLTAKIAQVHNLAPLASELNQKRLEGLSCYIVCQNQVQLERVQDLLSRFELPVRVISDDFKKDVVRKILMQPESERLVSIMVGTLHEGYLSQENQQWWLTDEEIFGKKTKRATSKKSQMAVFSSFTELTAGDFIIHMDHGIGVYRGLEKLEYDVNKNDFLLVEYLGGDKLYVPVNKLNRVQRFMAEEGTTPQLDKLGAQTWQKTRSKAKKAARKLAKQLLELQAKRQELKGHSFAANLELMEEFSASFEFEETPDQLNAIEEVYEDLESEKPMDRLICGDVGYGKTEVAMRATFKAVCDHKQVLVLVPTTVLAFQHYTTFSERFKNYPIKIELMSRFRTTKEQNEVIKDLKEGKVDIVVGTHRLLSKDIKVRDLGLLVVDEEHRFGVTHKERIKKIKNLVDVVTLTATPIPRTLNFALNGIRDLSIINTPPVDRLAIKTYTCYFDEITLRDAIMKEIRRGGQVYFVHNRVQSIEKISKQIAKLIPEARVRFAHGQMEPSSAKATAGEEGEGKLEEIMIDFMNHDFDILVCTTIIESGLDIPNANTIIINRADTFGLAQLYQLRGRVGRSFHQAYCYLIIPQEALITTKARKRLAAIQKFTELGSGFKVASRDLEIRGAGNILGEEQSGHIASIGYDLYVHLLQEAINEIKHQHMPEDFDPEIQLNMPAKIPDDYIADEQLRLILYKQVSSAVDLEELQGIEEEWNDRFGQLPQEMLNLIRLIKIKILCKRILVSELKQSGDSFYFSFHPNHQIDTKILTEAVQRNPKKFSITKDGRFCIFQKFESPQQMESYFLDLLGKMEESIQS